MPIDIKKPIIIFEKVREEDKPKMSMMQFLATDGGRRCPCCGKFAKSEEMGYTGFHGTDSRGFPIIVDSYGHLPGFGCNKEK